jgi:hypothetical protein
MRLSFFIIHISSFIILFTGCASHPEGTPAWLLNPQSAYPAAQYLVSVGEGDSRRAAENSATAGLARIFESDIKAAETLSETTVESRGSVETFDQFSELRSAVRVGSEQKLLNIQFGETFTDSRGRVHVAAFIPRAGTADIYRRKIEERAREIVYLVQQSDAAPEPVGKYAFRRAAVRKALENGVLLEQLRIIHPQARDTLSLSYDPQTLYAETADAARHVTFSVQLPAGAARDALAGALTAMGFPETEDSPALDFSGTATFEKTDLRRGALVFIRWKLNVEMRDRSGSLKLLFEGGAREGHISFEEAQARAQRAMKGDVEALLRRELGQYFDRLAAAE